MTEQVSAKENAERASQILDVMEYLGLSETPFLYLNKGVAEYAESQLNFPTVGVVDLSKVRQWLITITNPDSFEAFSVEHVTLVLENLETTLEYWSEQNAT